MTVTRVLAFRACTNAARNGAPSGPFTVPVIVAPNANVEEKTIALTRTNFLGIPSACMIPPCAARTMMIAMCEKEFGIWRETHTNKIAHLGWTRISAFIGLQCRRGYQIDMPIVHVELPC